MSVTLSATLSAAQSNPAAGQTGLSRNGTLLPLPEKTVLQNSTAIPGGAGGTATPQPRLVQAAHQFEASLMQELMSPLLPGHASLDGDGEDGSDSALSAFAGEAFAKALSDRGGFGIATRIIHQLSASGSHSGNAPTAKPGSHHSGKGND